MGCSIGTCLLVWHKLHFMTLFEQGGNVNINIYYGTSMLICKSYYFVFQCWKCLSDSACLFWYHLSMWNHSGLFNKYLWILKMEARKQIKLSQLESTDSIKAKVRYSLKYFVAPVEGYKELCIYFFLQCTTLPRAFPSSAAFSFSPSSPHGRCCGLIWLHRKTAVIQQTPREIWWQMGPDPGKLLSAQIEISFSLLLAEMK